MPGLDAIRAVLHPKEGNALYFVAKGDGSHHFSATLKEHNRAVRKYQLGGKDLTEKAVEQAIRLSQDKYCSVATTVRGVAEITTEFEIVAS
jgi:uncharacterized OsmC-like protein